MKQLLVNYLKTHFIVFLLIGCGKDGAVVEPKVTLQADLYTFNSLLDIGNNNNGSDIRAEVKLLPGANLSDILEVRFLMTKSTKSFTEKQISELKSGSYFNIPISSTSLQIIIPSATLKDTDGDVISNETPYRAFIAIIGKGNAVQLSSPKEITLSNRPTYAGKYIGTWEDLGPPGPGKFPMSMKINNDYSGSMFYASEKFIPYGKGGTTEDATLQMSFSNSMFSCKINQFIGNYLGNGAFGEKGGCISSADLKGNSINDVNLIFNEFVWEDCDGKRAVKLNFKRIE